MHKDIKNEENSLLSFYLYIYFFIRYKFLYNIHYNTKYNTNIDIKRKYDLIYIQIFALSSQT